MKKVLIFIAIFILVPAVYAQQKQVDVKIFLQKDVDLPNNMVRTDWVTVKRPANADLPLRSALEWLFKPQLTDEEQKQNIYEVDYGMKFEGVTLKKGTATVKFSETDKANFGTSSGGIFYDAIQKTAKQFRNVKRVKICVIGETGLDGEYDKPIFLPCK
ncbi:MAG TPA: GerMN domain-containing protein [Pyrinomonadaceae bacterium]|nr:GerMN domain-containing protein [Pyrinomonadaceae bacterium]